MKPKVIRTEEDYEAALAHIEVLLNAESTPEIEEELELISILVDKYEDMHFRISLPSPVSAIKFRMDQQGLKQKDLIPYIGSQPKVSEVLRGKRELSKEMIRRLHKGLGIPYNVLMQKYDAVYEEQKYFIENYPFNEMVHQGYFEGQTNVRSAKRVAEELLEELFEVFGDQQPTPVYCRHTNQETNPHALLAWQARVLMIVKDEELPAYDSTKLDDNFFVDLMKFSAYQAGLKLVEEHLNKKGIHFVVLPHLPKTYLDGAAFLTTDGNPVVAMTLRYDRLDNFWFTLMHEIAHVVLHLADSSKAFFDETEGNGEEDNDEEREANTFAREKLIPQEFWQKRIVPQMETLDDTELNHYAEEMAISAAILAGRLRFELNDYSRFSEHIGNHQVREHFSEYKV